MMRKEQTDIRIRAFLLGVCILCSATIWAQRRHQSGARAENYHFGYISSAIGYSSLSQNVANVHTVGDFAYQFGAGYEFRYYGLWVSVGAQYQHLRSKTTTDEYLYIPSEKGVDDQGKSVKYQYAITQEDHQNWKTIDVPLMVGYYNSGFYCGLGAKVGFSYRSEISAGGSYNLKGDYDRYVGILEDVNYYKTYYSEQRTYDYAMRPQFSLLGEVGYDLLSSLMTSSRFCHVLKAGFYFEYGLRSVRPKDAVAPLTINYKNVREATINPYYLSTQTEGKRVVPYFVGLKLTYMFGGSRNASGTWHKGCQCYQ